VSVDGVDLDAPMDLMTGLELELTD